MTTQLKFHVSRFSGGWLLGFGCRVGGTDIKANSGGAELGNCFQGIILQTVFYTLQVFVYKCEWLCQHDIIHKIVIKWMYKNNINSVGFTTPE